MLRSVVAAQLDVPLRRARTHAGRGYRKSLTERDAIALHGDDAPVNMNRIRKPIVKHVSGLYGDGSRDGGGLIQTERPLDREVEVDAAAELERAGFDERLQACDHP